MKKSIMLVTALFINYPLYANCGNDNGNGNGCSSNTGTQGPVGPQGPAGNNGSNGTNGVNGVNGQNGKDGLNAQQTVTRNLKGELDVRLWDTKHTSFYVFNSYGFDDSPTHDTVLDGRNSSYGVKFVVKLGKSYEERLLEKQQKTIEALERMLSK